MKAAKNIEICHGPRCRGYGGEALAAALAGRGIHVEAGDCRSLCACSPIVSVEGRVLHRATIEAVLDRLQTAALVRQRRCGR